MPLRLAAAILAVAVLSGCGTWSEALPPGGTSWAVSHSYNRLSGRETVSFGPYKAQLQVDRHLSRRNLLVDTLVSALTRCKPENCQFETSPAARPFTMTLEGGEATTQGDCVAEAPGLVCRIGATRLEYHDTLERGWWTAATPFGDLRIEPKANSFPDTGHRQYPDWRIYDGGRQYVGRIYDAGGYGEGADYYPDYQVWLAEAPTAQQHELSQIAAILASTALMD